MEIKTNDYRVWAEGSSIHYEGTMRLSGTEAYQPIQAVMDSVLAARPPLIIRLGVEAGGGRNGRATISA